MEEDNTAPSAKPIVSLEREKLAADLIKHVSTLATGSVVLVTTLLDKIPKPVQFPEGLVIAIWAFIICIMACFMYLFRIGITQHWLDQHFGTKMTRIYSFLGFVVFLTFLLGIGYLGMFATQNLRALTGGSN